MKKMNVESFNLDHKKVVAPYVRLVSETTGSHGDTVYKYDLRFTQPNDDHLEMPGLHALEHLMAENIRNHIEGVLDIGPMGCQTGFYLSVLNESSYDAIIEGFAKTLDDCVNAEEVPAANETQCGRAANHSLPDAKIYAKKMLAKKDQWRHVFGEDQV
ncbi:S-ribosylhomocysteine lyase /quorum-sensing autoinducer 2 (AI-2) synthesis protein LuxS [Streptohalobacillus salinus]|uniref:S-ribosylhomocysteine lyase n=1 Tax=Streptohalobacillus salinus TaxID=621096 RepID=A0A2V3WDR4_9BACI|nr:S-ribosylhomocysteine lyase [Streptohalobacillus salinus]PXW93040.1 S-ribosylhomocysteine lyase /quorum-sensing autoinducer 2 (AI-2) synthesis protein LuxS [Streptohalobacillus salinus]